MIQQFTVNEGNRRLILIFAGWGMDEKPFMRLRLPGHDIAVVWDYRDMTFCADRYSGYTDIYLFAWSFGVYAAARVLAAGLLQPTVKIAVNGSTEPVSDLNGIPEAIFSGTLDNLNTRTLDKFYRRMCSDSRQAADFMAARPVRDIEELRDELRAIAREAAYTGAIQADGWDRAVISEDDRIFPAENLKRAWSRLPRVRVIAGGAHLPDWQTLIEQELIDKRLVAQRFNRSAATYEANADVQRHIARRLWSMWLEASPRAPLSVLEAGYGTGLLTRLYLRHWKPYRVSLWELAPVEIELPGAGEIIAGDAEELIRQVPDNYYEAIASASAMQWFDSPARWLRHAARVLKPGGIIAVATFGPDNMKEVAAVTHLPLRYYSADELAAMVPPGCSIIAIEQEHIVQEFGSPLEVLSHIRLTGVNAMRGASTSVRQFINDYPVTDGRAPLTYHPIYMIIKKEEL